MVLVTERSQARIKEVLGTLEGVEARPYQERLTGQILDHFDTGIRSTLLESPTGSGKTSMGLTAISAIQREHNIGIGWVAMRRNLLAQAKDENEVRKFNADIEYISMYQGSIPTHDKQVRKIDMLLVDEAQHDSVNLMTHIHEQIRPRYVLGLTATPFRSDKLKLSFEKKIRDVGIHQLIQDGYLSPYHCYNIPKWDVKTVVDTYLREPERWGKSCFFWHKREDADECTHALNQAGFRTELVVADSDKEEQIDQFNGKQVTNLVNLMILTEGFNSPSLQTCWVRDSGKLPTIQMAGRVFRKFPGIEFKNIVQSENTRWAIQKTATPHSQFAWQDGRWLSRTPLACLDKVELEVLRAICMSNAELPKFVQERKVKKLRWGGRSDHAIFNH